MSHHQHTNILIIGGGILALTIARELITHGCDDILIIDKESVLGMHASGRNSGVLHAGVYYSADSLKAKYCLAGNRLMQAFCKENNLPIQYAGKVIVAKNENELSTLQTLFKRAQTNGARVDLIDRQQLKDIEPWAKTTEKALYSHDTAIVDPNCILQKLHEQLCATQKVGFSFNTRFIELKKKNVAVTNQKNITFNHAINVAGSYADQVARHFGLANDLKMIPFKGIYKKLRSDQTHRIRGNIYPVPDIRSPFLGVHFTKNFQGDVYVGPTAIPAFGRENYGLLEGIDREAGQLIWRSAQMFLKNSAFRQVVLTEPKKYFSHYFYQAAKSLVHNLSSDWLISSHKVGIRPQLVNWNTKTLLMDFLIEKTENSTHVLNAISPAFTSSMAMAKAFVKEFT